MPTNSTGQLAIWKDASAAATFALSPQDAGVRLRAIPAPHSIVTLPTGEPPNDSNGT